LLSLMSLTCNDRRRGALLWPAEKATRGMPAPSVSLPPALYPGAISSPGWSGSCSCRGAVEQELLSPLRQSIGDASDGESGSQAGTATESDDILRGVSAREAAKASRIFEEQERVMSLAAREAGAVLRLIEQQARDRAGAQPGGRPAPSSKRKPARGSRLQAWGSFRTSLSTYAGMIADVTGMASNKPHHLVAKDLELLQQRRTEDGPASSTP